MKYIRTKMYMEPWGEGIIDVSNWEHSEGSYDTEKYTIFDREVIDESDNILDLIDEVIIEQHGFIQPEVSRVPLDEIESYYGANHPSRERRIYLAIWIRDEYTGIPTLLPVAEVFDDGRIQLL